MCVPQRLARHQKRQEEAFYLTSVTLVNSWIETFLIISQSYFSFFSVFIICHHVFGFFSHCCPREVLKAQIKVCSFLMTFTESLWLARAQGTFGQEAQGPDPLESPFPQAPATPRPPRLGLSPGTSPSVLLAQQKPHPAPPTCQLTCSPCRFPFACSLVQAPVASVTSVTLTCERSGQAVVSPEMDTSEPWYPFTNPTKNKSPGGDTDMVNWAALCFRLSISPPCLVKTVPSLLLSGQQIQTVEDIGKPTCDSPKRTPWLEGPAFACRSSWHRSRTGT